MTTLHIKNMVCDRCKKVVKEELQRLGVEVVSVELGEVLINDTSIEQSQIMGVLLAQGFEMILDPEEVIIERIKLLLVSLVSELPMQPREKLSILIARELAKDYSSLSRLFSQTEQITIEKYFLKLKLEKVKELIQQGSYSFSEIAYKLAYSSVNHLSNQFKSTTGMSMSEYKSTTESQRKPIDKIV
jgi:AraC-like DNA-binding protein